MRRPLITNFHQPMEGIQHYHAPADPRRAAILTDAILINIVSMPRTTTAIIIRIIIHVIIIVMLIVIFVLCY